MVETIDELEPEERKFFMYDQKLHIDLAMGARTTSKEYEKLRLNLMGEIETVALEGFCTSCNQRIAFPIKITEFTIRLGNADISRLSITCPKCSAPQRTTSANPSITIYLEISEVCFLNNLRMFR